MEPYNEFAELHLTAFKEKMRITHDDEDTNLLNILRSSAFLIAQLVGARELDETIAELVFNRAMCDYNDALDEFMGLYRDEIETLYFINLEKEYEHAKEEDV